MKKKNLRSKEWFDNPKDPGLTALYLERYLNYGLKKKDLQLSDSDISSKKIGELLDLIIDVSISNRQAK